MLDTIFRQMHERNISPGNIGYNIVMCAAVESGVPVRLHATLPFLQ
eukprot:SAG11_NODE_16304_length_551_cov_1.132743_1_plen_45_part_10